MSWNKLGLEDGFGMAEMMYAAWYKQDVSLNLTTEQKTAILKRLSDLSLERAYWTFQDENFIEKFPELKPFSHTGEITGRQLYALQCELFNELHPEVALKTPYPHLPEAKKTRVRK